jgi:hypothetical protein
MNFGSIRLDKVELVMHIVNNACHEKLRQKESKDDCFSLEIPEEVVSFFAIPDVFFFHTVFIKVSFENGRHFGPVHKESEQDLGTDPKREKPQF